MQPTNSYSMTRGSGKRTQLENNYDLNFYADIYHNGKKIAKYPLETLKWSELPALVLSKFEDFIKSLSLDKIDTNLNKKKLKGLLHSIVPSFDEEDSDEELTDLTSDGDLFVYRQDRSIPAIYTTVPCEDGNIKGSTLIGIVYDIVRHKSINYSYYAATRNVFHSCNEFIHPTVKQDHVHKEQILLLNDPKDWFLTLGGWKEMIPSEEIRKCYCLQDGKFTGVQVYQNEAVFRIINERIHLPDDWAIFQNLYSTQKPQRDSRVNTDLSYAQIAKAIDLMKSYHHLNDAEMAKCQLNRLVNKPIDIFASKQISEKNQSYIITFLDYLNCLMFGMEASGLNASLVTSLMTLDLIVDGRLDYKTAFWANEDGGLYPYACIGDNKGTYKKREEHILHDKNKLTYSLSDLRENPSLSPVGIKEAILIKEWLRVNELTSEKTYYYKQIVKINNAIKDLIYFYFFPNKKRHYYISKFKNRI